MPKATTMPITQDCGSQSSVTALYAEAAHNKALWANSSDKALAAQALKAGRVAGDRMIDTPARTIEEVILKMTEALEWISEDASPAAQRLQSEAIRDLKRLANVFEAGKLAEESNLQKVQISRSDKPAASATQPQPATKPEEPKLGPAYFDKRIREFKEAAARPKATTPKVPVEPVKPEPAPRTIRVNRSARPVKVDGILYGSIIEAARATGIPYHRIRAQSL